MDDVLNKFNMSIPAISKQHAEQMKRDTEHAIAIIEKVKGEALQSMDLKVLAEHEIQSLRNNRDNLNNCQYNSSYGSTILDVNKVNQNLQYINQTLVLIAKVILLNHGERNVY